MDKFYIASVFGPLLIIVGVWAIFFKAQTDAVVKSIKSTPAVLYLGGVINVLFGLMIINVYTKWMWDLAILVTLLGWLMVLRGVIVMCFPQALIKCFGDNPGTRLLGCLVGIAWGIGLCILAWG